MSSLYSFRCWTPELPRQAATLVVFSGPGQLNENDLIDSISMESQKSLSPELVVILIPEISAVDFQVNISVEHEAFNPLAPDTAIVIYEYEPNGSIKPGKVLNGENPLNELPVDHIRRQGLTTLFQRRGGVLHAGPTAHFEKPSGNTSDRFLRASHALSEGSEIFFVALWMLPYITNNTKNIHVDTSAIASVAMAALLLKNEAFVPSIRTYHSYDGMHEHRFNKDQTDLVLISASQSGNMATDLKELIGDSSPIVTIFYSGNSDSVHGQILCDLNRDDIENPFGLTKAKEPIDKRSTRPIKFIGEHFVAQIHQSNSIVLSTRGVPAVVNSALPELSGKSVFSVFHNSPHPSETKAIWVNLEKLVDTDLLRDWTRRLVVRKIPASIKAIVRFRENQSSEDLTDLILQELNRVSPGLDDPTILSLEDLETKKADWDTPEAAIVVIGGAIGHGSELLAASRALRMFAPRSMRIYTTAAAMPSSQRAFNLLRSNLVQPDHQFENMLEIFVDRVGCTRSWESEIEFYQKYEQGLPEVLSERLSTLQNTSSGLIDNLFLEGSSGVLKLRKNFAFWPPESDCENALQSDVYVTIAVLIENLRSNETLAIEQRLLNEVQTSTVISAECFARYNDGVIQAAILRSALPIELNYLSSVADSKLMVDMIAQMIDAPASIQSEALNEFLLALALGRIRLRPKEMKRLIEKIQFHSKELGTISHWLVQKLILENSS